MKAVIYARYSSDNQTEASIEGQLRECMEFAERTEIDVIGNYIDRALTAKTDNRPEFQRMIKDSYKHAFDCIIVWKLDRFARNRYDSAHYKSLLKKNGVKVISAKESIGEGSEGILLESVLEGMGNFQCSIIIYSFLFCQMFFRAFGKLLRFLQILPRKEVMPLSAFCCYLFFIFLRIRNIDHFQRKFLFSFIAQLIVIF